MIRNKTRRKQMDTLTHLYIGFTDSNVLSDKTKHSDLSEQISVFHWLNSGNPNYGFNYSKLLLNLSLTIETHIKIVNNENSSQKIWRKIQVLTIIVSEKYIFFASEKEDDSKNEICSHLRHFLCFQFHFLYISIFQLVLPMLVY